MKEAKACGRLAGNPELEGRSKTLTAVRVLVLREKERVPGAQFGGHVGTLPNWGSSRS